MDITQAIILGIVQGVTEFLPISSSGHLILVPWWLGWPVPSLDFNVIIQLGTLLAVLVYFWRDWLRVLRGGVNLLRYRMAEDPDSRLFLWLILGSIPSAIAGTLFLSTFEQVFQNVTAVAAFLLVTALFLLLGERRRNHNPGRSINLMNWQDALDVGLAQLLALFPGVSRSGSTIAAGLLRGLTRDDAARFSFLLGTPALIGAGVLSSLDLIVTGGLGEQFPALLVAFLSAAVVGYLSIAFLLTYIRRHRLTVFAAYCAAAGLVTLLAVWLGR